MAYHKYKAAVGSDNGRYGNASRSTSSMNRSPILRHRRISVTRNHIPHKSSPYVGWFRHAPAISSREIRHHRSLDVKPWNANLSSLPPFHQEKLSPYVGWFRHAPRSNLYEKKNGCNSDRCNVIPNDNAIHLVLKKVPRKHYVSGRLPGGSPTHDNISHITGSNPNQPSVDAVEKTQNDGYSQFLSSREGCLKQELNNPLTTANIFDTAACSEMSSGVLIKFANWFLFPIVNDERTSFLTKDNLGEGAIVKGMTNGVVTLLPYLSSAFKRFFFLEDGTTKLNLRGAVGVARTSQQDGTTSPYPRDNLSETDVSEYSDYDSPLVHSYAADVEEDSYDAENMKKDIGIELNLPIEEEIYPLHISVSSLAEAYYAEQARQVIVDQYSNINPLASLSLEDNQCLDYSISQIDITRMARNASRHLDVESILKLPSITYKTTKHTGNDIPVSSSIDTMYKEVEKTIIDETAMSKNKSAPNMMEEEEVELGWSWVSTPENPEGTLILTNKTPDIDTKSTVEIDANEEAKEEKELQEEKCIICLEQFEDGDRLRVLPCGHLFHMGCIDKWLSGSFSHSECFTSGCPTCKKTPNVVDSKVDAGDNESILEASVDDSVPSWAFANLGGSLAMQV